MATVSELSLGIQSGTDRTMYSTWTWSKSSTSHYSVEWYYYINGIWFVGEKNTTTNKYSTYSAPANAEMVKVKVKAVAKDSAWSCSWEYIQYDFGAQQIPPTPNAPSVSIDKYTLTATVENLDLGMFDYKDYFAVEFQVVVDNDSVYRSENVYSKRDINYASFSCTVNAGSEYKVRCRVKWPSTNDPHTNTSFYRLGKWSVYSSNVSTIPNAPEAIKTIRASSYTSVYLEWDATKTATSYDIEYATKKNYLGSSNQTTTQSGIEGTHYELTGIQPGEEYFFRIRAVNKNGAGGWSDSKSLVIGKKPAAPTTWSSTTTVIVGEPLTFYWAHNAEDGSRQSYAEIEIYIDGVLDTKSIDDTGNDDSEDEKDVMHYAFDTSKYVEGTEIQWRVRTAGITAEFGDWSVQRTVKVYAPPTLMLNVTDTNGESIESLKAFPMHIVATAGPTTQTPLGYHLSVIANESYETTDTIGNFKMVLAGETMYSKHYDISEKLDIMLSAGDVVLENTFSYTIKCVVSMNSGLTAEASRDFVVDFDIFDYEPNAELHVNLDTYTVVIGPYCENDYGTRIEDVILSVYRREYDGSLTEIATGLDNSLNIFVTDPHPALDYARYRVVATSKTTGAVSYYDLPALPINGSAVIIQWDEDWVNFDVNSDDEYEQPPYKGSMLKLPYNIDVSDNYRPDVALVEYIGREHPVSYYGTQRGVSSNWNVEIVKDDMETLYALRRLARWMGDVYVREPSGSGYWANVVVTFSQRHRDMTIPVSLSITRVEGGM